MQALRSLLAMATGTDAQTAEARRDEGIRTVPALDTPIQTATGGLVRVTLCPSRALDGAQLVPQRLRVTALPSGISMARQMLPASAVTGEPLDSGAAGLTGDATSADAAPAHAVCWRASPDPGEHAYRVSLHRADDHDAVWWSCEVLVVVSGGAIDPGQCRVQTAAGPIDATVHDTLELPVSLADAWGVPVPVDAVHALAVKVARSQSWAGGAREAKIEEVFVAEMDTTDAGAVLRLIAMTAGVYTVHVTGVSPVDGAEVCVGNTPLEIRVRGGAMAARRSLFALTVPSGPGEVALVAGEWLTVLTRLRDSSGNHIGDLHAFHARVSIVAMLEALLVPGQTPAPVARLALATTYDPHIQAFVSTCQVTQAGTVFLQPLVDGEAFPVNVCHGPAEFTEARHAHDASPRPVAVTVTAAPPAAATCTVFGAGIGAPVDPGTIQCFTLGLHDAFGNPAPVATDADLTQLLQVVVHGPHHVDFALARRPDHPWLVDVTYSLCSTGVYTVDVAIDGEGVSVAPVTLLCGRTMGAGAAPAPAARNALLASRMQSPVRGASPRVYREREVTPEAPASVWAQSGDSPVHGHAGTPADESHVAARSQRRQTSLPLAMRSPTPTPRSQLAAIASVSGLGVLETGGVAVDAPVAAGTVIALRLGKYNAFGDPIVSPRVRVTRATVVLGPVTPGATASDAIRLAATDVRNTENGLLALTFCPTVAGRFAVSLSLAWETEGGGAVEDTISDIDGDVVMCVLPGEICADACRLEVDAAGQEARVVAYDDHGNRVWGADRGEQPTVRLDWDLSPASDGLVVTVDGTRVTAARGVVDADTPIRYTFLEHPDTLPGGAFVLSVRHQGAHVGGSPAALAPRSGPVCAAQSALVTHGNRCDLASDGVEAGVVYTVAVICHDMLGNRVCDVAGSLDATVALDSAAMGPVSASADLSAADPPVSVVADPSRAGEATLSFAPRLAGRYTLSVCDGDGRPLIGSPCVFDVRPGMPHAMRWTHTQAKEMGPGVPCLVSAEITDAYGNMVVSREALHLTGSVCDDKGGVVPCTVGFAEREGAVLVEVWFTPTRQGRYRLVAEEARAGVACLDVVVPRGGAVLEKSAFVVPCAGHLVAGEELAFAFDLRDRCGNMLDAMEGVIEIVLCNDDADLEVEEDEITVLEAGDAPGVYLVTTVLRLRGAYTLSVFVDGVEAPRLAATVTVSPDTPSAEHCVVRQTPPDSIHAGEEITCSVTIRDAFGNSISGGNKLLQFALVGDTIGAQAAAVTVSRLATGAEYMVKCLAEKADTYTFTVSLQGTEIPGASFTVTVTPQEQPDWRRTRMVRWPLMSGGAGEVPPEAGAEIGAFVSEEVTWEWLLHDAYDNHVSDYAMDPASLGRIIETDVMGNAEPSVTAADGKLSVRLVFPKCGDTNVVVRTATGLVLCEHTYHVIVDWEALVMGVEDLAEERTAVGQLKTIDAAWGLLDEYPDQEEVSTLYTLIFNAYNLLCIHKFGIKEFDERGKERGHDLELVDAIIAKLQKQAQALEVSHLRRVTAIVRAYLGVELKLETTSADDARGMSRDLRKMLARAIHPDKAARLGVSEDGKRVMNAMVDEITYARESIKLTLDSGGFKG